jgi:hypothetical protein
MAITLKASKEGLEKVDIARKKKGWRANAAAWYMTANTTEATLKRFRRGMAIQQDSFIALCEAVGVNWEEVADDRPSPKIGFEFKATLEEIDSQLLDEILTLLQQRSQDANLRIWTVTEGSVILILSGSQAGIKRLNSLYQTGELREILGIAIEDVWLDLPAVNLTDWLADNFTDAVANGWLTVTEILGERRLAFRNAAVKRAKEFFLGNNVKVALVIDLVPESDRSFNLLVYLYSLEPQYFPENLKLSFWEESGELLGEITATGNQDYIEQELILEIGETVRVEIRLNDSFVVSTLVL